MRAAFCSAAGEFELRELAQPQPLAGEVVVRVRNCGVCGSDLHWYHGNFPPPGVCPGHEIAGEVAAVGQGVALREGDRVAVEPIVVCHACVACRSGNYQLCPRMEVLGMVRHGGFAEAVCVPGYAVHALPASLDFSLAALSEPTAVCVHAVRLAGVQLGQRVLVLGTGTIGLLSVLAARAAGATVIATARYPHQAELARRLGASQVFTADGAGMEQCAEDARENPVDVVIETVGGSADTLSDAMQLVRAGGTVAVLGVFTAQPTLNAIALVLKEVRLLGSMVYGRMHGHSDFEIAIDLLDRQAAVARQLITHQFALAEIGTAFETASDKKRGAVKVTVAP